MESSTTSSTNYLFPLWVRNNCRRCNMNRIDATRWRRKIWIIIKAQKRTVDTKVYTKEKRLKLV